MNKLLQSISSSKFSSISKTNPPKAPLLQSIQGHPAKERAFIIGPQGGNFWTIAFDIISTFNTSKITANDIGVSCISKEEYFDLLAKYIDIQGIQSVTDSDNHWDSNNKKVRDSICGRGG